MKIGAVCLAATTLLHHLSVPVIELTTVVQAPIERCFDLARSIDLHQASTAQTREQAVAGVTTGLIGLNERVTFRARHFGFWHRLTSHITVFDRPYHFRDSMISGAFRRFDHDHRFEELSESATMMSDVFDFDSPFGAVGRIADRLFLARYMERFLRKRNDELKRVAESEEWREMLGPTDA